jgi:hypothetical protein
VIEARPFAGDRSTAAAFERWLAVLAEQAVEVGPALRYIVGAVAAAETAFAEAHGARVGEKDAAARVRLLESERRLSAAFLAALGRLEDAAGQAGEVEVELPRAVTVGGANVIPMPAREPRAGRCLGASAVRGRIVAALRKGGRMTKDRLRERVAADDQAFLRALAALIETGEVRRSGRGVKGNPYRYEASK